MASFFNIKGTTQNSLQLGIKGPIISRDNEKLILPDLVSGTKILFGNDSAKYIDSIDYTGNAKTATSWKDAVSFTFSGNNIELRSPLIVKGNEKNIEIDITSINSSLLAGNIAWERVSHLAGTTDTTFAIGNHTHNNYISTSAAWTNGEGFLKITGNKSSATSSAVTLNVSIPEKYIDEVMLKNGSVSTRTILDNNVTVDKLSNGDYSSKIENVKSSKNVSETIGGKPLSDIFVYTDKLITSKVKTAQLSDKAKQLKTPRSLWGQLFDGTSNVSGDMTIGGNISETKSITPNTTGAHDIGTADLKYKDLYLSGTVDAQNIKASSEITAATLTTTGGITSEGSITADGQTVTAATFKGNLDGNANTSTKLETPRSLWGQSFDGSADVSGDITVNNIIFSKADTYNIGNSTKKANNIYSLNAEIGKIISNKTITDSISVNNTDLANSKDIGKNTDTGRFNTIFVKDINTTKINGILTTNIFETDNTTVKKATNAVNATNVVLASKGTNSSSITINAGTGSTSFIVDNVENAINATNVNLSSSGTGTNEITINAGTGSTSFTVDNVQNATTAGSVKQSLKIIPIGKTEADAVFYNGSAAQTIDLSQLSEGITIDGMLTYKGLIEFTTNNENKDMPSDAKVGDTYFVKTTFTGNTINTTEHVENGDMIICYVAQSGNVGPKWNIVQTNITWETLDAKYVKTSGDEEIDGNKSFKNDVKVKNSLVVTKATEDYTKTGSSDKKLTKLFLLGAETQNASGVVSHSNSGIYIDNANILTSPKIQTGSSADSFIQTKRIRSSASANDHKHAIDLGDETNKVFNVYESGGVFKFWKNTSEQATTDNLNLMLGITDGALLHKSYTYNYPEKNGTLALIEDFDNIDFKNLVTIDTEQTITGEKSFNSIKIQDDTNTNSYINAKDYFNKKIKSVSYKDATSANAPGKLTAVDNNDNNLWEASISKVSYAFNSGHSSTSGTADIIKHSLSFSTAEDPKNNVLFDGSTDIHFALDSSKSGLSLTSTTDKTKVILSHKNKITAGSSVSNGDISPDFGGTFKIPSFEYDENGHITSVSSSTITLPTEKMDTNTWRAIKVNGTQFLSGETTSKPLDIKRGPNVSLSTDASTGAVTIDATDTTYSASNKGISLSGTTFNLSLETDTEITETENIYPVGLKNNKLYVNVPWSDTKLSYKTNTPENITAIFAAK